MTNLRNIALTIFILIANFSWAYANDAKDYKVDNNNNIVDSNKRHHKANAKNHKKSYHQASILSDTEISDTLNYKVGMDLPDPYERSNRAFFQINKFLDRLLIKPTSDIYSFVVPKWGQDRVGSALSNLTEPLSFLNNALQGRIDYAMVNFFRFLVNSTVGVFGLLDVASLTPNLQPKKANFDNVLQKACVEHGSYIIIPFIGPSTNREAFGKIVDSFIDPVNYAIGFKGAAARSAATIVQFRTVHKKEIEDLEKLAIDEYVMLRSIYAQKVKNNSNCKKVK